MHEIKLKAKEERRLKAGHWWIFSNEIDGLDTSLEPGTLVRVISGVLVNPSQARKELSFL